jgi:SAM-dependent methyltransferase
MDTPGNPMDNWQQWREQVDLDAYDERWRQLAESGDDPHGEADLVCSFEPASVLDGGCGTGRVGIELAHRGIDVVGVDLDPDMLARARLKAPDLQWVEASHADLDLGRTFDLVVLAGNVIPFVEPDARPRAVRGCARHLGLGGRLITGFGLRAGWPTLEEYDGWCATAGLELESRWASWDRQAPAQGDDYAVSVHRSR